MCGNRQIMLGGADFSIPHTCRRKTSKNQDKWSSIDYRHTIQDDVRKNNTKGLQAMTDVLS